MGTSTNMDDLAARMLADVRSPAMPEPVADAIGEKVGAILERARRQSERLDAADALTYHVRLIFSSEHTIWAEVQAMVAGHRVADDPAETKRARHQLGEALRSYAEGLAGTEGVEAAGPDGVVRGFPGGVYALNLLAAELLSTAFAWVDWDAIASDYLNEFTE